MFEAIKPALPYAYLTVFELCVLPTTHISTSTYHLVQGQILTTFRKEASRAVIQHREVRPSHLRDRPAGL